MRDWFSPDALKTMKVMETELRFLRNLPSELWESRNHAKPEPWTPENDPTVPAEFLLRYRTLTSSKFLDGMVARAYLRLKAQPSNNGAGFRKELELAVRTEYKARYGFFPSPNKLRGALKKAGLAALIKVPGRPKAK
jgi:hypothetical protein